MRPSIPLRHKRIHFCLARTCATLAAAITLCLGTSSSWAQEARWIWSSEHSKSDVPQIACYFRKTFKTSQPQSGRLNIAADDHYEVYINGRNVGAGSSTKEFKEYDISKFLARGGNVIAIKVENRSGSTAALAARLSIQERGEGWTSYATDSSWRTNLSPLPLWNTPFYNDSRWTAAQSFGRFGETPPWDVEETFAGEQPARSQRFTIDKEFSVERLVDDDRLGSLIAMTFNEFGHILASQEGGPLLLLYDSNNDSTPDKMRIYCDKVKNCQGILALNGEVFVTADGPDGNGLYRLADADRDGRLEDVRTVIKFRGESSEHGAHGIRLGPDGLLYVVVGNHARFDGQYDESSPHRGYYEGDLVRPRYEDPGGHAVGIKAPGGVVLRTDIDGESVELYAGGLRNAYDLAFNRDGELFTYDSDMESDMGAAWYRPTRLYHVTAGAEFGWRSGWAKWPDYFIDCLPPIAETGRGSPTGVTAYDHYAFPQRFHNALFLADWSEGRILSVRLKRDGATYSAETETFLEGQPLNVTDLDVGPDGWLYFVTGGRGAGGGLYRIRWNGAAPHEFTNLGDSVSTVIRQPQLSAAFSRQKIAVLKSQMGGDWKRMMEGVARSNSNPAHYRLRALDVLQLYGPAPGTELLIEMSGAPNEEVRAKAAQLLGMHSDADTQARLIKLLDDSDRAVRRAACEALVRAQQTAPAETIIELLASDDRFESWAARRLLERLPLDEWRDLALESDDQRVLAQGALALMIAHPGRENGMDVLGAISDAMAGFVTDRDFVDLLRVMQVALMQGEIQPPEVTVLRDLLAEEFPAGNAIINRELVRLATYLQATSIVDRYLAHLQSDAPDVEKLHLALHLRFLQSGWTTESRMALLRTYERLQKLEGGSAYSLYVMHVTRDFAKSMSDGDVRRLLAEGDLWPNAALGALYKLPERLDDELIDLIQSLDRRIEGRSGDTVKRLQVGIVAVLARSGDERSMSYLRQIWDRDPERRPAVAMGLAQSPDGDNWPYLVRSLAALDGAAAREVLRRLKTVPARPEDPEFYRQVILRGLELKEAGADDAVALLKFWTGETPSQADDSWSDALAAWQEWFAATYSEMPAAELPELSADARWSFVQLMEHLTNDETSSGSASRGQEVFAKAQCGKCHRFGDRGESIGPQLTGLHKRFSKKEVLEAILFPSHVISDQYATKNVITTNGRTYTGIVAAGGAGERVILQSNGEKVTLREDDIEEMVPSKVSTMPSGLLDNLTLEEITDLFTYLGISPQQGLVRRIDDSTPLR